MVPSVSLGVFGPPSQNHSLIQPWLFGCSVSVSLTRTGLYFPSTDLSRDLGILGSTGTLEAALGCQHFAQCEVSSGKLGLPGQWHVPSLGKAREETCLFSNTVGFGGGLG